MISSVLIATISHSRPVGLARLLKHLEAQQIDHGLYLAICVVDNDCTGRNDEVVARAQTGPYKIDLIKEPQKGIVHARNKAVEFFLRSDFEALAFIDDDEWPEHDHWAQNLIAAQAESQAPIITGDVVCKPDNKSFDWVAEAMGRPFKAKNLMRVAKFYSNNVLILRNVLETIQPAFDPRFNLSGGEDLHFAIRCRRAGFKAIYTSKAPAVELFPASRASISWFIMRGFCNGSGAARAALYEAPGLAVYGQQIIMAALRFGRGSITSLHGILTFNKGRFVLGLMRGGAGIGTIAGLFGGKFDSYKTIHGN